MTSEQRLLGWPPPPAPQTSGAGALTFLLSPHQPPSQERGRRQENQQHGQDEREEDPELGDGVPRTEEAMEPVSPSASALCWALVAGRATASQPAGLWLTAREPAPLGASKVVL